MNVRDDFENRLGQGLKRWAQAGEPSIDLEALVRQRTAGPTADRTLQPPRRWVRWLSGMAATAAIIVGVGFTFPSWAGAAANWPLVGPFITQLILEDAGFKWAYDLGLIGSNVAEVTENGVTVRILGVLADSRRTTVLYQVLGLPYSEPAEERLAPSSSSLVNPPEPSRPPVDGYIAKVNGQGAVGSYFGPEATPLGYFGIMSTLPLETDQAELELRFRLDEQEIRMTVPASRVETDRFSHEVAVDQTVDLDGIRVTVEAVIYTPAETVVRYREEKEHFSGSVNWDPATHYSYLEIDGKQYRQSGGNSMTVNNAHYLSFPPVESPARLVLGAQVKGVAIEAIWPLEEGAVVEVMGAPITLTEYQRTTDGIGFRWEGPDKELHMGIGDFESIDAEGQAHPLGGSWSSISNYTHEGVRYQYYASALPEGVEAIAIRAKQAAVLVEGPWVFELPR